MTTADSPVFLLGFVFGASLLCAGILGGALLPRRERKGQAPLEPSQVIEFLRDLVEWTHSMAHGVAEYQEVVDGVAKKFDPQHATERDVTSLVESSPWLTSLVQANQRLKCQLEEAEAALQRQTSELECIVSAASTDPLTGLPNRRMFEEELKRRFAEWRRHGAPFSVLLVDVDNFKKFNDRYGHLVGDRVLKQVASALVATMRDTDLVSRFGGEEFAAVLPASGAGDAGKAAERVRLAIERVVVEHERAQLRVTVSCGIAHATTEDIPERMIERADKALYAAKDFGRNAAFWHDGQRCVAVTRRAPSPPDLSAHNQDATAAYDEMKLLSESLRRRLCEVVETPGCASTSEAN